MKKVMGRPRSTVVKNQPPTQETQETRVGSLGQDDPKHHERCNQQEGCVLVVARW